MSESINPRILPPREWSDWAEFGGESREKLHHRETFSSIFLSWNAMKHGLRTLCLLIYISTGITVIVESIEGPPISTNEGGDRRAGFDEGFASCLAGKRYATFECVNRGALSALRSIDRKDDLDFGDVHLERADGHGREALDWDYDPKDFGNVVKAATELMERRSLRWNLDNVYPGLELRAGPTLNGNGILEFVVNEKSTVFGDRQTLGPGEHSIYLIE